MSESNFLKSHFYLDEPSSLLPGRDMLMLYLNPHSLYLQFVEPQDFPRYHLVCKDWHDACVLLLLEHRANGHPDAYAIKLPMSLAVFKEVSAAKALLDPTCTTDPKAWCHRSLHATIDATVAEVLNALSGTVPLLPPLLLSTQTFEQTCTNRHNRSCCIKVIPSSLLGRVFKSGAQRICTALTEILCFVAERTKRGETYLLR